jgi:alkanesulfonate monooxygenase SsuD/methylene tetrahydromethanopterin reductase-like flavin-dependent oxidoreductase (luciferase family)
LRSTAAAAETLGYSELWLSEDCFLTGGIAGAGIALGATTAIPVGIGAVSALTRHPAVLAMELATLERAFPGRLRPAIGLGVPSWLDQMGLRPSSAVQTVHECLTAVRGLLAGKHITETSSQFVFDGIQLNYPVAGPVPIQLGVAGPRMLRLSGSIADGTLLSVLAGTDYVRWARHQITGGAHETGGNREHQVTCFALCSVSSDEAAARATVRPAVAFYLASGGPNALTDAYGISDELREILAAGGLPELNRRMPDRWVRDLALAGTPDQVLAKIRDLLTAGANRVALLPIPTDRADQTIELMATEVLPNLDIPADLQH